MRVKLQISLLLLCVVQSISAANIIPQPTQYEKGDQKFVLTDKSMLLYDAKVRDVAMYLIDYIPFKHILCSDKPMQGDVVLDINRLLDKEGYRLTIDKHSIKVEGGGYGGVFNGVQTLLQLLPSEVYAHTAKFPMTVEHCRITDKPKFAYRGMMLDVTRTWIEAPRVKRYIDLLAYHKINKLHFHLSDDEGWRVELKSHPEFATIGGFRGGDSPVHPRYAKFDERWGGYYTQNELRDIVRYAAQRNIEVIPEIDMPGHSRGICAIKPEILCNFTPDTARTNGLDIRNVWCASKESNYRIIEDIVAELSKIFTSEYIHIGGDEVNMSQWRKCPDCQRLKRRHGLANDAQIEDYFIARTTEILKKYGKKPAVWNEAIDGGTLDKTTRVHGWKGIKHCKESAERGYPTIVMAGEYFYFDMKHSMGEEGHTWAGIVSPKKVHSFNFEKCGFTPAQLENIIGIEATFFSEIYIANHPEKDDYLDYMHYPRVSILSELMWSKEQSGWDEFASRLYASHYHRMRSMGVAFRLPRPVVKYANGELSASTIDGSELYYTDERTGRTSKYKRSLRCDAPQYICFESRFGKARSPKTGSAAYHKLLEPTVTITSSLPCQERSPLTNVEKYGNRIARTARPAKRGDWIEYRFAEPLMCREILARTGHIHLRRCHFMKGRVELSYDGVAFERVADLVDGGAVVKPQKSIVALRIVADSRSDAEPDVVIQPLQIRPL
ncbi:MAG: beta-N-acetylhexosaminidase [Alistipes sp.]|nr:beta-N-acetylhexosaminidase [Alistipes sp.]